MGRLNRPIRVRFRDKIKSLLKGQVILLYLKRGDVSIKSSKRLEGKPFSLAGRGRSPAAGVHSASATLAALLLSPST
jgi:hypothetical protein